jgi:PAS domain S-box-containing protein
MKNEKAKPNQNGDLRRRAEERLKEGRSSPAGSKEEGKDALALIHELQVHQIELEMQNEELKLSKLETEQALTKCSDLYDFSPIGLFAFDVQGLIQEVNLAGARLLGKERRNLMNRHFQLFVAPKDRPFFDDFCKKAFETSIKQTCELSLLSDGKPTVYIRIEGIVAEDGSLNGRQCRIAAIDLTERKKAERILGRYQLISKYARDVVLLMGRDGSIIEANEAAINAYGYTLDELLSRNISNLRAPETLEKVSQQMQLADSDGLLFETKHRRKDGSTFPVEVSSQGTTIEGERVLLSIIRDITERQQREKRIAKLSQLYSVLSRVNEAIVRTRDERSLYSQVCQIVAEEGGYPLVWVGMIKGQQVVPAAWFGTAADYLKEIRVEVQGELSTGPIGTCIRDDRSVVNVNLAADPATLPWRKPALHYGFHASAAFPLHRQSKAIGTLTLYAHEPNAFDEEQVALFESLTSDISYALDAFDREQLRLSAEQGLNKTREELERRVQERTEDLEGINEVLRKEIEEHERTERDLVLAKKAAEKASGAKAAFLANMSHEIRTPMNAVIGFTSLLLYDNLSPEHKDYVEGIRKGGDAMMALINDILDFSRADKEKLELELQPLSLKHLIDESLGMVALEAEHRGLNLACTISYRTPDTIIGDYGRLRQILVNLLSNAVKFTDKGEISVSVSSKTLVGNKRQIRFSVKDSGIGIPQDKMSQIFEPFTQLERTISSQRNGAGLGLAISKKLVEIMGGEIWVESVPSQGATFHFTVPAETIQGKNLLGKTRKDAQVQNLSKLKSLRILVAEDNPSNQRVVVEMLKRLGYRADAVADGKEVVQALKRQPYDLVLMDVRMPEMDGLTATRVIRKLQPEKGPKIVAITAYALEGDREKCFEAGMDDYISKPVQIRELEAILIKYSGQAA